MSTETTEVLMTEEDRLRAEQVEQERLANEAEKARIAAEVLTAKVEAIAKVTHNVNKAFCEIIDDTSQKDWSEAAEWQMESARAGVRFTLDNPDASPSQQHENWMADKIADGWVYGEVKDEVAKTHPCLVAYEELPIEQQMKDKLFKAIVKAYANSTFTSDFIQHCRLAGMGFYTAIQVYCAQYHENVPVVWEELENTDHNNYRKAFQFIMGSSPESTIQTLSLLADCNSRYPIFTKFTAEGNLDEKFELIKAYFMYNIIKAFA